MMAPVFFPMNIRNSSCMNCAIMHANTATSRKVKLQFFQIKYFINTSTGVRMQENSPS